MISTVWRPQIVTFTTDADGSALTVGTDAYTAGDVVGGLLSAALQQQNGGGYVAWVKLVDDGDQAKGYYIHLFWNTPSSIADDAAFAPTEADKLKRFTTIQLASGSVNQDGADSDVAGVKDYYTSEFMMFPNLANGKLYAYIEDIDASNPTAATDITLQALVMAM